MGARPILWSIVMALSPPSLEILSSVAASLKLSMTDAELSEHLATFDGAFAALDLIDDLADDVRPVSGQRSPGVVPVGDDNPLNAWARKVSVRGAATGRLSGRKVVLKDNIALAGVPMLNGTPILEGYVPEYDATVVTRLLNAGAEIVGKAHCEGLCLSGGSHTGLAGPVRNPHDPTRTSGGSSSGCGALVGSGEVQLAIGGDQGGSIRLPSSFSGCVGMKPTWGLVPYSGIFAIEPTVDHVGPMTSTVADNALLLEIIAGDDGLDPRQKGHEAQAYTADLERGVAGLRIAVVSEGFGRPESESDVDELVHGTASMLGKKGAHISTISLPWHDRGAALWTAIAIEGLTKYMMLDHATGMNWKGFYPVSLLKAYSGWVERADELPPTVKNSMLLGKYLSDCYNGLSYAKAQNLSRSMRAAIDAALAEADALLMPTTPMKAPPLPSPDAGLPEYLQRAFEMINNTCPYNVTGHPAISVPCGKSGGLPVGAMLVGRHHDETKLYRIASEIERSM